MVRKTKIQDPNSFRIHRQKVGLTYSCPTDMTEWGIVNAADFPEEWENSMKAAFVTPLVDKFGECDYLVSEEMHQNGKRHYHCYFKFYKVIDVCDPNAFNLFFPVMDRLVHPNIINPGKGWITYVAKHSLFITNFHKDHLWFRTSCMSVKEAMQTYAKEKPDMMANHYSNIQRNLKKRKADQEFQFAVPKYRFNIQPFVYPQGKCFHIYGLARAGKTQYAKTMFPNTIIVSCHEELDIDIPWDEVQCIVFDDFILKQKMSPQEIIHLLDREEEALIGGRYYSRPNRHQIPKIFTSNERHIFYDESADEEIKRAIEDRISRACVTMKLF